ncbi:MAG: helix-turn-helix domain-containing protein [Pseudomonadota bacterium]
MDPTATKLAYTQSALAAAADVPVPQIRDAIRTGELPAVRSGRRTLILAEDAVAWLRRCRERGHIPAPVTDRDRERLAELNRRRVMARR